MVSGVGSVLTLDKLGWFVAFSESSPYPSKAIIPLQTQSRFTREQYPMPFYVPVPGRCRMLLRVAARVPHQTEARAEDS
ncbi:hypothetical protein TNCV_4006311 [Trichonephila clavipes]|nr:hypothetical protein TNCV_4006311 [Trichonephila clavipes]